MKTKRHIFEMTPDDLEKLLKACRPVPYIIVGGYPPLSPQENANSAWAELGRRMGFDPMTVLPHGDNDRFFSAITTDVKETT